MKSDVGLLLCLLSSLAGAQPVYRCGNAYSQAPCPSGGRLGDATDPRSAAQRAEARRVAADERRLAVDLQRGPTGSPTRRRRSRRGSPA